MESEICSVMSTHGLYSPWNSPGQNTGMGSLSLLQRIFPTQESNPGYSAVWVPLGNGEAPIFTVTVPVHVPPAVSEGSLVSAPSPACITCRLSVAILTCVKGCITVGLTCASQASAVLSVSCVPVGHSAWSLSLYSCPSVSSACRLMPVS